MLDHGSYEALIYCSQLTSFRITYSKSFGSYNHSTFYISYNGFWDLTMRRRDQPQNL
jgi:hypothetical protein